MRLSIIALTSFALTAIGIAGLGVLAWNNWSSKSIVLAWGALFSSFIYLSFNTSVDLKTKIQKYVFNATYWIDRDDDRISQYAYPDIRFPERLEFEIAAGHNQNIGQLEKSFSGGQLAAQLANLSFLQFLMSYAGWGQNDIVQQIGIDQIRSRNFDPDVGCSRLTLSDLNSLIARSGSAFNSAQIGGIGQQTCLPPGAWIRVQPYETVIQNAVMTLTFSTAPQGEYRGGPASKADPKTFRYLSLIPVLILKTELNWAYSQNADIEAYRRWFSTVETLSKEWFKPYPVQPN